MTQGSLFYSRIFNVMVEAIIRELRQVFGVDVARLGMEREIAHFLAIFYADDGYTVLYQR